MEYKLTENTSKKYYNGSIWPTKHFGNVKIIGRIDQTRTTIKNGKELKAYIYYLVEFEDGTRVKTSSPAIRVQSIRNPNKKFSSDVFTKGETYIGTKKINDNEDHVEEFTNQDLFCKKYDLCPTAVSRVIRGERHTHKKWRFSIKGETKDA